MVQLHRLWVLHLLPLSPAITSLLEIMVPSMCATLQQMLRRVSAQLVDLAPSFAITVARYKYT